ncbi:hypothetical protein ZIOFF_025200 [Zingiber officinale]|uniref:Morc S5 domain-containing protein n=1 Tax=Zingiber officinale TaxID=94328 RepID=A0A8J5H192_ZINOF|nr:hypothetical protein ZIOFF_025200 [Zingiber officinale]
MGEGELSEKQMKYTASSIGATYQTPSLNSCINEAMIGEVVPSTGSYAPLSGRFWSAGDYEDQPNTQSTSHNDGGGMDPILLRRCMSFGFSNKEASSSIGQYGNGFKTSTMRLGADAIVFTRCMKRSVLTQSVGLLSYTFLRQEAYNDVVVPAVDYSFDPSHGVLTKLFHNSEEQFFSNLSVLLKWSPFLTENGLLENFNDMGSHGTKIIIYNLWHNDMGETELDFETDEKAEVVTTIGFLKEFPHVNVHGFNIYYMNRLILPFHHVASHRGKGVVGVLEANYLKPTHDKQGFERSSLYEKLEARLKQMTYEYWVHHSHLVGYEKKIPGSAAYQSVAHPLHPSSGCSIMPIPVNTSTTSIDTTCMVSIPGKSIINHNASSVLGMKRRPEESIEKKESPRKQKHYSLGKDAIEQTKFQSEASNCAGWQKGVDIKALIQENIEAHEECLEHERIQKELLCKVEKLKHELEQVQHHFTKLSNELLTNGMRAPAGAAGMACSRIGFTWRGNEIFSPVWPAASTGAEAVALAAAFAAVLIKWCHHRAVAAHAGRVWVGYALSR